MWDLDIRLFGKFAAITPNGPADLGAKEAELLAYLALRRSERISRVRVAGAIWPDHPERRARANLSTALWRLRVALSKCGCLSTMSDVSAATISLDAGNCGIDAEIFKEETHDLSLSLTSLDGLAKAVHAVDLYTGDLLADWDAEWCRLEREELRQRYVTTLHLVSDGFERRGRYDLALRFARRAVATDPLDESAQRSLIRLLAHSGERTSAITQFHRFAQLARDELGVDPAEETRALLHQICRVRQEPRTDGMRAWTRLLSTDGQQIVGREGERLSLQRLMAQSARGEGGGALILGDIGTGKTKLASWALEEWSSLGYKFGLGRCIEFNEPVPYQPLWDAFGAVMNGKDVTKLMSDSNLDMVASASGESMSSSVSEDAGIILQWSTRRLMAFARLAQCLREEAREEPLLFVIEDIQWADAGTIDLLGYLLEHIKKTNMAFLLTSRPASSARHSRALERLRRQCSTNLRLNPLTRSETTNFIESLLGKGQMSSWLADWIHDDTEGNPLFVLETLRLFGQRDAVRDGLRGVARDSDRASQIAGREIPEGVRAAVEQRLALLDRNSHRVAQIASVLGRSFTEEMLDLVVGGSTSRLASALSRLILTGIFERENATYRFTHDKLRAVCYEGMPVRVRRSLHARAAAVLEQMSDVPLQRLAWHQHCAGKWESAATTWELAGDHAMIVFACEEALSAFRHAIACLRRTTVDAKTRSETEVQLFLKLDSALAALGRPVERVSCLERVGELCQQAHLRGLQSTWCLRRASLEEHVGNFRISWLLSRRAWLLASAQGDKHVEVDALRSLAWALNRSGRHRRSAAVSRLALRKLGDVKSPALVATLWQAAVVHIKLGEFSTASAFLDRAENLANKLGLVRELYYTTGARAVMDKWTGRISASRSGFTRALQMASDASDKIGQARALFHLATLDAFQGNVGASLSRLRKAMVLSRSTGYTRTYLACLNNVAYGTGRLLGDYLWAWKAATHALHLAEASGSTHLIPLCKDSQVLLLMDQGRFGEAKLLVDEVLRFCEHESEMLGPNQESITRRGIIWIHLGEISKAIEDLEFARQRQTMLGERLILVDTLSHLAIAYLRAGDPRAVTTSEESMRVLTEIGGVNMQPQRIFWHHFCILEELGLMPRLHFLQRAAEAIEAQAATLSRAQQGLFRTKVSLNRTILAARDKHQSGLRGAWGASLD